MLRWLPEDVSPYGAGIDSLFYFIYYLTAVAFIVVTALMIIFLYVYRDQGGRRATYTHGNTALEIIWTIIPAMIFIGLGLASRSLWEDIKLTTPETDTVVKVTGKQFNWEILYPGPDGEFDTADDKQVDNDIRVPAGKPVRVVLSSKDVLHSFFLPNLRFKQDTVPGREIMAWFQANKPGKYEIPCAELCGFGHSGMVGWLYALEPAEYQAWQNEQWPRAASSNGAVATNGSAETVATETSSSTAAAASTEGEAAQEAAESAQETATEAVQEAAETVQDTAAGAADTAQDAGQSATSAAGVAQDATDAASATTEAVGTASEAAEDATQAGQGAAEDVEEDAADSAQDAAGEAAQTTIEATHDAAHTTTTEEAAEAIKGAAVDITQGITGTAHTAHDTAEDAAETSQGAAATAAVSTAISSVTQKASDTVSAVQDTVSSVVHDMDQTAKDAAAEHPVQTSAAQISMPAAETQTPATVQETPAEGSSSEATMPASDQESSANASSDASPDKTALDGPKKYAFTPAAEPRETCQGELEIVSGATIYELAQEFYEETKILLGVDLIRDYNPHIANLDNIYPGQKLCIPTLNRATRLRQSEEGGSYKLILDSFRSTRKANALIRQVKQKGYEALLTIRQVSDSLLLKRVEITGLQDQTTANQAWAALTPANAEDLS